MKKSRVFLALPLWLFCLFTTFAGLDASTPQKQLPPLPNAKVIKSRLPNIEDDIRAVLFEHEFTSGHPKVEAKVDLIARTAGNIKDFSDGNGWFSIWKDVPANRKILVLKAYEAGDPRIEEALVYAKAAKLRGVLVISDGNIVFEAVEGQFKNPEVGKPDLNYSSDFSMAKPSESNPGKVMNRLLKTNGFSLNEATPYTVVLAPLGNKAKMKIIDIMHEKQVIYVVTDDEGRPIDARWEQGSNNLNPNPRINMRIEHNDPLGALYAYERALAMRDAFKKGLPIKQTVTAPPLRILYEDPSAPEVLMFQEIGMTDGQNNWNRRIAARLYGAAGKDESGVDLSPEAKASLPKTELDFITFADFVETFEPALFGLGAALEANPKAKAFALADGQFLYPLGFGDFGLLAGFPTIPPLGSMRFPLKREVRERIKSLAYIRGNPGQPDRHPGGPPTGRTVMHLKFKSIQGREGGVAFHEIFDGSLNLSNHYQNAETQTWRRFRGDSRLAAAIVDAIHQLETLQPEYVLPAAEGIFAEIIAHILGVSVLDIENKWVKEQIKLAQDQNFKSIRENILALEAAESRNVERSRRPSREFVTKRLEPGVAFLTWYRAQTYFKAYKMNPAWLGVVAMMSTKISEPELPTVSVRRILDFLLKDGPDVDIEARIQEAWKILGISAELPPPLQRRTSVEAPETSGAVIDDRLVDRAQRAQRLFESKDGPRIIEFLGAGRTNACGETLKLL